MLIIVKKPSSTTEPAVVPPQPQNPANHQNQTTSHNLQPPSPAGAGPQQPSGWLAPQMQATTYATPGLPTYPQPPVASALPSTAYAPQPQASYAYTEGGYALPGNTFAHPVTLQPQLSSQLTAQERSQQEAFNREMQAFNQVNILLLISDKTSLHR
jgi:hypothetical protein